MRALRRLGIVDYMVMSIIVDGRSTKKAKCIGRDVSGYEWLDVAMDNIPVKIQRRK